MEVRTTNQRLASAVTRWDAAIARQASARVHIAGSRWLIDSAMATLTRRRPAIARGGDDDVHIEQRLRTLIQAGSLPFPIPRRLFAGKCLEEHTCTACDLMIRLEDPEFEWTNPGDLILYFHRRCVDIYRALVDGHKRP